MMRQVPRGPMPLHNEDSYKIRCQCCQNFPQIMGEVIDGLVYIRFADWDPEHRVQEVHWRWLTQEQVQALAAHPGRHTIRCVCCVTDIGRWLAEVYEGHLVLRGRRHGRTHFVTLSPERLQQVLAAADEAAYAFPQSDERAPLIRP